MLFGVTHSMTSGRGSHQCTMSKRRKKRKDTDAEREGRVIKNGQKQSHSAQLLVSVNFVKDQNYLLTKEPRL